MDQETIIRKRRKGDHAVPDIKEKQLVEPLQSGSISSRAVHRNSRYFVHSVSTRVLEVRYSCYYVHDAIRHAIGASLHSL